MKGKKILFTAVMVIVLCASLITGATFALFTGGGKVDVAITAGTIQVEAYLKDEPTLSSEYGYNVSQTNVSHDANTVTVTDMVPGDIVEFTIQIFNKSSVDVKYQTVINISRDNELGEALVVEIDGVSQSGTEVKGPWNKIAPSENPDEAVKEAKVKISLPATDNPQDVYQGKNVTISYAVVAIQGNYYTGPKANVRTLAEEELPSVDDFWIMEGENFMNWGIDFPTTTVTNEAKIVTAYEFSADETGEQAIAKGYDEYWVCDFVIECDDSIALGELGLAGAFGAYENGTLVAFANPVALAKNERLAMLTWVYMNNGQVGPIPYPAVCEEIGAFGCGLFTPYTGAMSGKTVTVHLVMANLEAAYSDLGNIFEDNTITPDEKNETVMNWINNNWNVEENFLVVKSTSYTFN